MLNRCPTCKDFIFSDLTGKPHRCPPAWHCWISDPGYDMEEEDGRLVYATSAESAAEMFAAGYDAQGDYVFMDETIEVSVRRLASPDELHKFSVGGEMVPAYQVRGLDS